MTGSLKISTRGTLSDELNRRVIKAVEALSFQGIKVVQEQTNSLEADIIVDVIDMRDISQDHIKSFLVTLFPGERKIKGITAFVRHREENKIFKLPMEIGECVDWFRIE